MVLNLTVKVYVRNVISFFYKQKPRWNIDIWNFFGEKFNFMFHCKSAIWTKSAIMTSLQRHTWNVCTFWYVYKEETRSNTMVPNNHIKFMGVERGDKLENFDLNFSPLLKYWRGYWQQIKMIINEK